ncbi:hypothetical protein [Streptomyces sp. NPDC001389]
MTGLEVASGRARRLWEHEPPQGPAPTLAGDTLVAATPALTGVALPG